MVKLGPSFATRTFSPLLTCPHLRSLSAGPKASRANAHRVFGLEKMQKFVSQNKEGWDAHRHTPSRTLPWPVEEPRLRLLTKKP